jgi:hypothetical protein
VLFLQLDLGLLGRLSFLIAWQHGWSLPIFIPRPKG